MKLYATPLSHFSRKVRLLLDAYSIHYELIDVGNVAESPKEKFADNPLSRVPVLVDDKAWIIDSDSIAEYISRENDPEDRYQVVSSSFQDRNTRAILNGIMLEEVTLILARRMGVPTEKYAYFDSSIEVLQDGLHWLERRAEEFTPHQPRYLEFHFISAWDHLHYYDLIPKEFPKLKSLAAKLSENPLIRQSSPEVLRPKHFTTASKKPK